MDEINLSKRLEEIRKKIEDYEENGYYDPKFEEEWKKILDDLNNIKIKIYKDNLFSPNEEFAEVATENIKFLLVAFYQSEMIQKFQTNRKQLLNFGLKFYKEFYNLLNSYHYLSKEQIKNFEYIMKKEDDDPDKPKKIKMDFNQQSMERQRKIEMYKYKKNLSEKLKKIEKEGDFDGNREFWTDYLNICIVKMYENIKLINQEIETLDYIEKMKKEHGGSLPKPGENKNEPPKGHMQTLKINSPEDLLKLDPNNKLVQNLNFITTTEQPGCMDCCFHMINGLDTLENQIVQQLPENIRANVFKNSNPTTMTMDEFAELQRKRMEEHHEKELQHEREKSDDDSDKEEVADKKTKKAREWDDWKDDHPKGSGNRMGKNY